MKMDEGTVWMILIIGIALIIAISIIVHEKIESPYDKCLDRCSFISQERNPELFVECIKECNVKQNREGG